MSEVLVVPRQSKLLIIAIFAPFLLFIVLGISNGTFLPIIPFLISVPLIVRSIRERFWTKAFPRFVSRIVLTVIVLFMLAMSIAMFSDSTPESKARYAAEQQQATELAKAKDAKAQSDVAAANAAAERKKTACKDEEFRADLTANIWYQAKNDASMMSFEQDKVHGYYDRDQAALRACRTRNGI